MTRSPGLRVSVALVVCAVSWSCADQQDPLAPAPSELDGPAFAASEGKFPFAFPVATCEEVVDVSGWFHPLFNITTTPSGRFHVLLNLNAKGTGIGQSSGASYQWNDALPGRLTFNVSDLEAASVETFHGNTRLIGQGRAADYKVTARFHIVVTPGGVANVTVDRFDVTCR